MNSKQIGNIGEAKVLSKFIELGFPVYIPFGDNEKADLVVEFNGKLNKIQIKTSVDAKNGNITFDLTSSTAHRKNGMRHKYTIDEVDYFALYVWLELEVWDYSNLPFNFMGQICLPFSFAWTLLSGVAIVVDDYLRYLLFGEEKPHYKIL